MPISAANKALYPPDWQAIRARILERDGGRCKQCGVWNHAEGWRDGDGAFHEIHTSLDLGEARANNRKIIEIVLTIAHTHDPDPANCADDNLAALCQRCHNILDMPMRQRNARATRLARKATGDLFGDMLQSHRSTHPAEE